MGRLYIRTTAWDNERELIDVSVAPVHIIADVVQGTVSVKVSEMDYTKWQVLKLQDGPKTDAVKAAEFLVDMLTLADAAMESNEHSRIIEYAPESKGFWRFAPVGISSVTVTSD